MIIHGPCQCLSMCTLKQSSTYFLSWNYDWLVVWNMNFMNFHNIGNVIIPTDELIFFRGVGSTTNQIYSDEGIRDAL